MDKFIAEKSFWDIFPEAELGIMTVRGLDNSMEDGPARQETIDMLAEANREAEKFIDKPVLSQCSVVSVWRDAFQKFKKKKGNRASIEALLNRIQKGKEVGPINPLVDIYNAMSLKYGLPCGGEDADTIKGDMRLTITEGGDSFLALGDTENDPTLPGELCYIDDEGAVCRCWNWRDGVRTMLTEDSKNVFLIFESVDPSRHDDLVKASDELEALVLKYLGGTVAMKTIITKDNTSADSAI